MHCEDGIKIDSSGQVMKKYDVVQESFAAGPIWPNAKLSAGSLNTACFSASCRLYNNINNQINR